MMRGDLSARVSVSAALATSLSQVVSFVLLLAGMMRAGGIQVRWRLFSPSLSRYRALAGGGLPVINIVALVAAAVIVVFHATLVQDFRHGSIVAESIRLEIQTDISIIYIKLKYSLAQRI